jgi:hypothetical protein
MAEFKMTAGGVFHTLTKEELDHSLKSFMVQNAVGARPVHFSAQGTVASDGTLSVGGAVTLLGGTLGPTSGFYWVVNRLAVRVGGAALGTYSLFINSAQPQSLVRDVTTTSNGYIAFTTPELVLNGDDTLVITATGQSASALAVVTGQAIEVPSSLLWKVLVG